MKIVDKIPDSLEFIEFRTPRIEAWTHIIKISRSTSSGKLYPKDLSNLREKHMNSTSNYEAWHDLFREKRCEVLQTKHSHEHLKSCGALVISDKLWTWITPARKIIVVATWICFTGVTPSVHISIVTSSTKDVSFPRILNVFRCSSCDSKCLLH